MVLLKKLKSYIKKNSELDKDIEFYLNSNHKISPYSEALRISIIYGIVGALWILLSDKLLGQVVTDINTYIKLATYKGWAYVVITMVLIYTLVIKGLLSFEKAIKKIYNNFEELNSANEESIALKKEAKTTI